MFFSKNKQKNDSDSDKSSPSDKKPINISDLTPPKIGLSLGSGLARGFAHIGVIRALKRHGIEPTIIAGTSMGAVVGAAYLVDGLDRLESWAHGLSRLKMLSYLDFRVNSAGLIGGKRLMRLMHDNFGDILVEDLPHPFIAISSDLVTGHEVWLRTGRLIDVLQASFAVPGIFPPVFLKQRWLIDGALVNPVPVSPCLALNARMTIAVNPNADLIGKATRPGDSIPTVAGFDFLNNPEKNEETEESNKLKSTASALSRRIFRREENAPSLFGVLVSSINIAQDRVAKSRLAGDPPDVTINPRIGHIGLMEFDRADELIEEGEAAVERALPDIKAAYSILCTHYTED